MLILLRHGQSEANAAGQLVGRHDAVLTELGSRQAEAAGRFLAAERKKKAEKRPVIVLSSPLRRARATAEMVSFCLDLGEVRVEEALIELDYGDLDGLRLAEVSPESWAAWRADPYWRPPNGETLVELQERVWRWCSEIAPLAAEQDVIAISHVSPIKAAAAWALGTGPELSWRLALGVATMTRIATSPPGLHSFGESGHLSQLA